jgi:hypothetical protein
MWQTKEVHLHFSFSLSSKHSYLLPLIGFGGGAALFANGFWNYRRLRLIQNTPRIAVRAVPMGLVHVHGKVTGEHLLTSPVTGTPCYYYHVQLERWEEQGKHQGWNVIHTATDRRNFYVDDGTGKVLINPQGAEYDLPRTYRTEFGPRGRSGPIMDPSLRLATTPTEQDWRAYAAKADPAFTVAEKTIAQLDPNSAQSSGVAAKLRERQQHVIETQSPLTGHGSYRITEICLMAEHEYDVIGTCVENPQSQQEQDRNLILKGQNEKTFIVSGFSELRLEKILRKRALIRILVGGALIVIFLGIIISELLGP